MSKVIFIGGPTACGKTTFTSMLNETITDSVRFRRVEGFYELGKERELEDPFKEVKTSEVDDYFINKCMNNEVLISDVHYAIQMNRNHGEDKNVDIHKEYVPTISKELLEKLVNNDIEIIAIYLECSPKTCFDRAIKRYDETKKSKRNISLEDATLENLFERTEWENLCSNDFVKGIVLNTEEYYPNELVDLAIQVMNEKPKIFIRETKNDL